MLACMKKKVNMLGQFKHDQRQGYYKTDISSHFHIGPSVGEW